MSETESTSKTLEDLLQWDLVYAWADAWTSEEPIGMSGNAWACPLHTYLHLAGVQGLRVWPESISRDGISYRLPTWATSAVIRVDKLYKEVTPISGKEFTKVLLACKPATTQET